MNQQAEEKKEHDPQNDAFNFDSVENPARIAFYDSLLAAPRITEIRPAPTIDFIENLASETYKQAQVAGGQIPYTVIREVTENFIHARFSEITVSILSKGNVIRFADQGPGIPEKEKAKLPGFSSAIEPMKKYIRGVGSGLPIVKEYLNFSHGNLSIEDNIVTGAVITISLKDEPAKEQNAIKETKTTKPTTQSPVTFPQLSKWEKIFLPHFLQKGQLGVTDLSKLTGAPVSSTHAALTKMEQSGILKSASSQKRSLTEYGIEIAHSLSKK